MNIVFHYNCKLPVRKYGGTERIIYWLMQAMAKAGHHITFIGFGTKELENEGIHFIDSQGVEDWRTLIPKNTDILHLNYPPYQEHDLPVVYTLHGNAGEGEEYPENTICITKRHALNHGADFFIFNPVNFDDYPVEYFKEKKQLEKFLFLAKASWSVKNLKDSIRLARKLKKKLDIIGGRTYLPRPGIKSYGFLGGDEKLKVIQSCDAFLFPVRWQEPFGIAIVEAMALGLPVFGSSYGSLPEMVSEGCGKVFQNFEEMLVYFKKFPFQFDSKYIRQHAIDRFNHHQQAEQYVLAYERVIAGEKLNSKKLKRNMELNPGGLLPF